jgi:hypothetical protein
MRIRLVLLAFAFAATVHIAAAQQTPTATPQVAQRDPQALRVLEAAFTAMGTLPADSAASGTVTTVAGSLIENGSITILTRGTDQTSEQIQTSNAFTYIYSRGRASTIDNGSPGKLPMDVSVSAACPYFPLPLIAGALANPDESFAYIGLETLNGTGVQHVQFWNTFASIPELQHLSHLSLRDVWIDTTTGLPQKISFTRPSESDSNVRIHVDVHLSEYRNVSGVIYPFRVEVSLNGTPWLTINLQNVTFNTGLDDRSFPVSVKEGQ